GPYRGARPRRSGASRLLLALRLQLRRADLHPEALAERFATHQAGAKIDVELERNPRDLAELRLPREAAIARRPLRHRGDRLVGIDARSANLPRLERADPRPQLIADDLAE